MTTETVIKVENLSKQYRLGTIGTGTLSHDLNRWWAKIRGKEDPYLKLGQVNEHTKKSSSEHEYVWALHDMNFEITQGEVIGIIGKNGAGKSTLLKILSRVTSPTTGTVKAKGRIASLLEVGTGFHPELTGRENIFLNGAILGMSQKEIRSKLDEIVEFSGVSKYIDTPVKRYSSGMYVRLAFAVAAHLEAEILLVDEVLAVGDAEFQEKCLGKMKDVGSSGRTVIFVSHNMASVKSLCKRALLLKQGQIVAFDETGIIISKYQNEMEITKFTGFTNGILKSSYPTETGKITSVRLLNTKNVVTGEFMFEEELSVEITFKIYTAVKNINVDTRIISSDGITLCLASTLFDNSNFDLETGQHTICLRIENKLNPGIYSFHCGIHYPNNSTIDAVKNILYFRVGNINTASNKTFIHEWSDLGYYRPNARWNVIQ